MILGTVILVVPGHTSFFYNQRQILQFCITENINALLLLPLLTPRSRHFCEANIQLPGQETCLPTFVKTEALSAPAGFYPQPHETNTYPRTHLFNIYVTGLRYYLIGLNPVPRVLSFFQVLWIKVRTQLTQTCYALRPSHKLIALIIHAKIEK